MIFNKFVIQHIMKTKFINIINNKVAENVRNLDDDEYGDVFLNAVDMIELDYIDEINIDDFDIEENDGEKVVSGEMAIDVEVNGLINQNEEWLISGGASLKMGYAFEFTEDAGDIGDLYLEHIY